MNPKKKQHQVDLSKIKVNTKQEESKPNKVNPFQNGETFGKRIELSTFLFALITGLIAYFLFAFGNCDSDFLWHAKLGEWITNHHTVPTIDIFSWIGAEKKLPFTAHSWLFSVWANQASNYRGVYTGAGITVLLGASTLYFLIKTLLFPRRNFATIFLCILLGILCANPRPGLWSFALFVLAVFILKQSLEQKNSKLFFLLPLISLIWANVHGGTILILIATEALFFFLGILPNFQLGFLNNQTAVCYPSIQVFAPIKNGALKEMNEFFKDYISYIKHILHAYWGKGLFYFGGSILAALCNPYGSKIFTYGFIENNEITKKYIGEWQPILLKSPYILFIILVLLVYLFLFYKGGLQLHKLLPTICFLIAGAFYQRFIFYGVLTSLFLLSEIVKKWNKKGWITWKWNLVVIAMFLACLIILPSFAKHTSFRDRYELDSQLSTYLSKTNFQRPYTQHNDGGRLIYANHQTFIDQRITGSVIEDGILLELLKSKKGTSVEEILKTYEFDAFVLNKKDRTPLETYLRVLPNQWSIGFENKNYVVFIKTSPLKQ